MLSAHTGAFGAMVCLTAALTLVCPQNPPADLPVTRLSGDAIPQTPPQARPAPPSSKPLPALLVTEIDDRMRTGDLDAPQRLSVSFAEPANVRDVLMLLVRGTPLSIAVDPGVTGAFVGELKDVTLRRAIDAVLVPNGLAFDISGSVLHVYARRTETRYYDLNFLNVERRLHGSVAADEGSMLSTETPAGGSLDDAAAGVQALLSDAGRLHVDRRAALAQVTDYADRLDRVGAYVEALHLRGTRQVRLQVRVLEVALKGTSSIDWRTIRARLGVPDKPLTAGAIVDPAAVETLLASQGDVHVVAAPDLIALNNEPAVVRTASADASALTLTVVPQISADGIVQLSVSPSWRSRGGGGAADTIVRLMDGSTAMLSGLLRPDESGTRETVVLLTPTVVNAGSGSSGAR